MMRSILMLIAMLVIFFFVFIVPEQKRKHGNMNVYWRRFMSKQGAAPWLLAFVGFEVLGWFTIGLSGILFLYLGIAVLIAGVVCLGVGMYKMTRENSAAKKPDSFAMGRKLQAYWKVMPPVPWIVLGCIVSVIGGFMIDAKNPLGYLLLVCGVVLVGLGVTRSVCDKILDIKKEQKDFVMSNIQQKIDFYNECKKNGIHSCQSEKEIQKATLIAQRMKIPFDNIHDLYTESRALQERKASGDTFETLEEQRRKEKECCKKWNQYAKYTGRDKRIAILTDLWQEAEEAYRRRVLAAAELTQSTQEKEKNWAVLGGIAEGLAGPAAGLAVAADAQLENARIRERNEVNRKAIEPLANAISSSSLALLHEASNYEKALEEAKIKLVAGDSAENCLNRLTFRDTKVTVSQTGTCHVETVAELKAPFFIFDDVPAVIDGTIIAQIYDGGTCIGNAEMVLPCYGIRDKKKLEGLCLFAGTPGKQYTVKFTATNLWAMEQ